MLNGEKEIQQKIYNWYGDTSMLIIPNFTPADWWECDIFRVLKSGYTHEYEIKLSKKDYMADFKKQVTVAEWVKEPPIYKHDLLKHKRVKEPPIHKHNLLKRKCDVGPNRFSFVFGSVSLLDSVEVPDYAGILVLKEIPALTFSGEKETYFALRNIRNAPLLHKKKIEDKVIKQMNKSLYYRFWTERAKNYAQN